MIKVSRDWATPVTAGVFLIMAATGVLMFFHLDTGLNKTAHEWLGWLLVAAVLAHGWANWLGVKRYLKARRAQALLLASAAVLGASFLFGGAGEGPPPPVLSMQAVSRAPLNLVLPLAGKSFAQAQAELGAVGIPVHDGGQTLQGLSGGDRGKLGLAVRTLFAQRG